MVKGGFDMEEILKNELRVIESEIIRFEALAYEIERHLKSLESKRSTLLSVLQKSNQQPVKEASGENTAQ